MAHPDPKRTGAEDRQREHVGKDSRFTDAGVKRNAQGTTGGGPTPIPDEDRSGAASGERRLGETRTNDLEPKQGLVAPGERSDQGGPVPDTGMTRETGAGAAGGRDTSGGSARGAGAFGRESGQAGSGPRETGGQPNEPSGR